MEAHPAITASRRLSLRARLNRFLFLSAALLLTGASFAQIALNQAQTPAWYVQNVLVGAGVTVSNVKYNGSAANAATTQPCVASFTNGIAAFPMTGGLVLTSGNANIAPGPNNTTGAGTGSGPTVSDPDLTAIASSGVTNGVVLEFDFITSASSVSFQYIFGSEEYLTYVGSSFNDVFGFFLSGPGISGPYSNGGVNLAVIPPNTPVTINNVNPGTNSTYYMDNPNGDAYGTAIQYNGTTIKMTAQSAVQCGQTYHIKLCIANVGDMSFDSGVFISGGSFAAASSISAGLSQTVCGTAGTVVQLAGNPGNVTNQQWSTGGTGTFSSTTAPNATYTLSAADIAAGTVTLTYSGIGCGGMTITSTMTITLSNPTVSVTPNPATICTATGSSVVLTGTSSPAGSVKINKNFSAAPNSNIPNNNATGVTSTIAVTGITPNNAATNNVFTVLVNITHAKAKELTIRLISPSGQNFVLVASAAGSLFGTGPNFTSPATNLTSTNTPTTTASPTVTTTYTYTVTDAAGCSKSVQVPVIVTNPITPSFTPLTTVCQGASAVTLPTGSTNSPAITGTWSPTTLGAASTGTFTSTFMPAAGQCALSTTISLTVSNPVTPTFTPLAAVCQGGASVTLPTSSTNGTPITGTWNPTTLGSATAGTFTATFTPAAGQCAVSTTISLTVNSAVVPTFAALAPVCQGGTAPTLVSPSTNGVAGTWSPASFSTASAGSFVSTFTPSAGACATTTTINFTVNAPTPPTFPTPAAVCQGDAAPALPTVSNEGNTGSWNPATFNTSSAGTSVCTFTPTTGTCVTTATLSLTINPPVSPTFTAIPPMCQGAAAPALENPSGNGIAGSWNPATISTASTGSTTYTFTPSGAACATTATLVVNITTPITPTFALPAAVCQGDASPALPPICNEGISGTWNPTTFNTSSAGTSVCTFTPSGAACATTATLSLTINPPVTPTFPVPAAVCEGAAAPTLPPTSNEGFAGIWNPTTFNSSSAGTSVSTFTPSAGICATTALLTLTINPEIVPTFPTPAAVCQGDTPPALPTPSNEGIAGAWNPATFNTASSGASVSTFTPSGATCATTATLSLTVNAPTTPTFAPLSPVCEGAASPSLPPISNEGINGTWSPTTFNTATVGTLTSTFTPAAGQCATTAIISLIVTNGITPTFDPVPSICQDATPPALQLPSNEGATGSWSPAVITTATAGSFTFTFTPDPGQCANTATLTVTIDPLMTPTFAPLSPVCQNDAAPTLPTSSTNGIAGAWNAAASTAVAGTITYTFTPGPGQCATTATLQLLVNAATPSTFTAIPAFCNGSAAPALPSASNEGFTGDWSPATISNTASGTYDFTPDPGQCATTGTISITVNPNPTISVPSLSTCSNVPTTMTASGAVSYDWSPSTGLNDDDQPSATATLLTDQTYTITGTDANGCIGTTTATVTISSSLTILVTPSSANVCAGGCVTLSATGGTNYTWTGAGVTPNNAAVVSACPAATTTYTVDGETAGCLGSTTVTVIVGPPVTPTFNAVGPICSGSSAPILPLTSTNSPAITGTWNSAVNTAASGTYTFTPAPTECATTASLSIVVNTPPSLGGVIETCNNTNTFYTVQVTLTGGNVATYSMIENAPGGIGGSFAGNVWTSNPIPSGTAYDFDFDDASGCGPVSVVGMKNCNCSTFAGTMNNAALTLCDGDVANVNHNGNHVLDGNDVLGFVLHSGSGTMLGTVYGTSTTPSFSYTGALTYGTTYYISAIAGDNNGSGGVLVTDPCLSVATGIPVVWYAKPVAVAGNNGPVCEGDVVTFTCNSVPGASYSWTGPNGFTSTSQNPTIATFGPGTVGPCSPVITVNGCSSDPVSSTATVNAQTQPTFATLNAVCVGDAAPTLSGTSIENVTGGWNGAPSSASAGTQNFTFPPTAGLCATTTTLSFTVNALPVVNGGSDVSVCEGISITLSGGGTGAAPVQYDWTNPVIDGQSFVQNPGSVTYTVTGTDANGCQNTDQVTVLVSANPVITASASQLTACLGESITFTGGGGVAPYPWDNGVIDGQPFTPATAGTVTYTVGSQNAQGCAGSASVTVTVFALPTVDGGPDQTVCPKEQIVLAGSGAVSYVWDGASDNIPFIPVSQIYTVTGTDANGCQNTDQVVVTVSTPPQADFGVTDYELSVVNPTVTVNNESISAVTYSWTFGDNQGTSTAVDPTYTYNDVPATYTITLLATSAEGCTDEVSRTILVKDQLIFWVPNTFTPDGDAYNNTFQPVFSSGYDPYNFVMLVYDRWGEVVFETHDVTVGWDGTYNGELAPEGIYTWTMQIKNPQNDEVWNKQGHIQILK